jgi:hypothetical protein
MELRVSRVIVNDRDYKLVCYLWHDVKTREGTSLASHVVESTSCDKRANGADKLNATFQQV